MSYTLHRADGTVLLELADRTIDKSVLPIALLGRHAANIGVDFNENLIRLLENFSGDDAPSNPISGMIWYDTAAGEMKLWTGSAWQRVVNGSTAATPNTIVERDSSGNITTNVFVGALSGNATTATTATTAGTAGSWTTARALTLSGNVTGAVAIDGSANVTLSTAIASVPAAAIPATGVTPGYYTNVNIWVGADGRVQAAASGGVPAHSHSASEISDIDSRIDSRTNVNNTIKSMRRVGGPNVYYTYVTFYASTNVSGQYLEYRAPAGAFVTGTINQAGTYGGVGAGGGTPANNYYTTEYIQYYMNGGWITIG